MVERDLERYGFAVGRERKRSSLSMLSKVSTRDNAQKKRCMYSTIKR